MSLFLKNLVALQYIVEITDKIDNKLENVSYGNTEDEEILTVEVLPGGNYTDFSTSVPLRVPIKSEYFRESIDITKSTKVDIVIEVPNYNESYTVSTVSMNVNPYCTKVLTADNLYINNNKTTFNGEVFVNNNLQLRNNSKAVFNRDLAVKNNIDIYESAVLETKNVYTENIFLNGKNAEFKANLSNDDSIQYEGVVVKDDLELNYAGQKVEINGPYYGFGYGGDIRDNKLNSAIIINNNDVELSITGDLYLMGTSYIKELSKPYATGESLSIKGNYIAYSVPINYKDSDDFNDNGITDEPGEFDESRVEFDYDSYKPFPRLVEWSIGDWGYSEIPTYKKAKYIKDYSKLFGSTLNLGNGKIVLSGSKIGTNGAVVNNGSIMTSTEGLDGLLSIRGNIENAYNIKTKKLGFDVGTETEFSTDKIFENIKNLSNEDKLKLTNKINYASKELLHINYVDRSNASLKTYVFPSNVKSGLVITNQDIEIAGNVDFTGVIICTGDITIKDDDENKVFRYNKGVITTLIAENDLHDKIFKDTHSTGETVNVIVFGKSGENANVNFGSLVNFENWRIN